MDEILQHFKDNISSTAMHFCSSENCYTVWVKKSPVLKNNTVWVKKKSSMLRHNVSKFATERRKKREEKNTSPIRSSTTQRLKPKCIFLYPRFSKVLGSM